LVPTGGTAAGSDAEAAVVGGRSPAGGRPPERIAACSRAWISLVEERGISMAAAGR
jgi:hypothetical protein